MICRRHRAQIISGLSIERDSMSSFSLKFHQSSRAIASVVLTALFALGSPVGAYSQYGVVARTQQPQSSPSTTQQDTTQNSITKPIAQSPDIPPDRVGVTTGDIQSLTMQDAITLALQNNLDIEQFRQGVRIADRNLYSLKGVYDILSTSDVNYRSTTQPVVSIFGGAGTTGSLGQKTVTYNFTKSQFMQQTGGYWEADLTNAPPVTKSTASLLTQQYLPHITEMAKKTLDLTDSQFRQRVIEIVNSVQRGYWDLVFAIRNEKIAREYVELARQQLDNNRKMVDAGTLAPIELRSTEAQLETAKGNVILALQGITTAENALKALLLKEAGDKMWYQAIAPTDEPQFNQPTFNLEDATRLALKNRPELEQIRIQTEQKNIDIKYYTNQTKPQLDLVGNYGSIGLAGTPSTIVSGSSGFDSTTQGILNNLNLALSNLNLSTFNPAPPTARPLGANVLDRFNGGYFQALHHLFTQDFKTYQIGVHFSFPWRNRTAEGNLGRTMAEARQLDARQRQLVETVQVDVRNALQAVVASRQRFEAARAAELAADAQYKGEQERDRAGLSTNFVFLQRQTDLSVAKGNSVRALTDYNKALADLQRFTGTTLVSNNVQISSQDTTK